MKTTDSLPIQIKATRAGFTLAPAPDAPFELLKAYLEERLAESRNFFLHSRMMLDLRERPLQTHEILALRELLEEKAEVRLDEVKLSDDYTLMLDRPSPPPGIAPRPIATQSEEGPAPIIIRSTCRSGARIVAPSDCVVLGDVNPGAEVIAAGDIIVFGNLRGMAHAGATGNRSARIWALSINPNQLRIADLLAVPPRNDKSVAKRFEVAEVQGGLIEIISL